MSDLPEIERGTQWGQTSARQWRNAMELVSAIDRISTGDGILLRKTAGGLRIERADQRDDEASIIMPGAMVRAPEETSGIGTYWARGLRYAGTPPVAGQYAWRTQPMPVEPEIGTDVAELEAMRWDDPEPAPDMPVIMLHRRSGTWYAHAQSVNERIVILRGFEGDDPRSRFVVVHELRPILDNGQWTGGLETFGDLITVPVWPTMKAENFAPFVWQSDTITDAATPLPLSWWRGAWWLKQRPKRAISRVRAVRRTLECSNV